MIAATHIETPLGTMIAGATDEGICLFDFEYRKMMPAIQQRITVALNDEFEAAEHPLFAALQQQLDEYFAGTRQVFDLPLVMTGTSFQKRVWQALLDIPYGSKSTYLQQSVTLGDEKAIRAVARANGENCLAIIVPCHRVIGTNGNLTGYAGGLKAKQWLLDHEAKHAGVSHQLSLI